MMTNEKLSDHYERCEKNHPDAQYFKGEWWKPKHQDALAYLIGDLIHGGPIQPPPPPELGINLCSPCSHKDKEIQRLQEELAHATTEAQTYKETHDRVIALRDHVSAL